MKIMYLSIMHINKGGNRRVTSAEGFENNRTSLCSSVCGSEFSKSYGKVLHVDIFAPNQTDKVLRGYAIIDEQSTHTFATTHVFDMLGMNISPDASARKEKGFTEADDAASF